MLNCIFSKPLVSVKTGEVMSLKPPNATNQNFQFSIMDCSGGLESTTTIAFALPEYISTTTGDFYVQKTFTYGEVLILAFLIPAVFIVLVFGIRKILIHKFLNG